MATVNVNDIDSLPTTPVCTVGVTKYSLLSENEFFDVAYEALTLREGDELATELYNRLQDALAELEIWKGDCTEGQRAQ